LYLGTYQRKYWWVNRGCMTSQKEYQVASPVVLVYESVNEYREQNRSHASLADLPVATKGP